MPRPSGGQNLAMIKVIKAMEAMKAKTKRRLIRKLWRWPRVKNLVICDSMRYLPVAHLLRECSEADRLLLIEKMEELKIPSGPWPCAENNYGKFDRPPPTEAERLCQSYPRARSGRVVVVGAGGRTGR